MIQIGFDPVIEQEHRQLIKQVELYRLAQEVQAGYPPKSRRGARLLAMVGQGMASLGSALVTRFSDNPDGQANGNNQTNPGGCTS